MADRNRGLTWPLIAERHGVTERQRRNVFAQWRAVEKESLFDGDAVDWLTETLARLDSMVATLAAIAEEAPNDSARVGALRVQLDVMRQQAALMVASGLLPQNLRADRDYDAIMAVIDAMLDVVERHDVGVPVLEDLLRVIDSAQGAAAPVVATLAKA